MKLERIISPKNGSKSVNGVSRPHPCEREGVVNITLVATPSQRNYAFGVVGRRILSLMSTDKWPEGIDNAIHGQMYGLLSALRSITSGERKKLQEQMKNDEKRIINVFTTIEAVVRLIQEFSRDAHSIDDQVPGWILDRLDTLTTQLGVTLVPRLVAKDYYKISQLYSFAARISSDIPRRDPLSEHVLPAQYMTTDIRLTDPFTFHALKRERQERKERSAERETATAPAAAEAAVTA